ncbi:MAG: hypothetical protein ABIO55_03575 [Ginsengibacter sp.]
MLRSFLCFAVMVLMIFWCTAVTAQYFYRDIWNARQLNKEMFVLKEEKIKTIVIKSFDNDGEPSQGFFCEKRIGKNYTFSETVTRSDITSQSLLTSYFNSKGLISRTADSSESSLNTAEYLYNSSDNIIAVQTFTTANDDLNSIDESHDYFYNAAGQLEKMVRKKNNLEISVVNFKVDEKGNVTDEEEVLKNGRGTKYFYYYDGKNNLTDVVHYNQRARRLLPDYMYEYSTGGQLKQMITTEEGGGYFIWKYTYNDQKLRETERCFSKEKKLLGSVQYIYK